MNERIRELAEQAVEETQLLMIMEYKNFESKLYEKFAELIVQECIRVSEAHANDLESQPTDPLLEMYDNGIVSGIYEATEAIKEHFGVE
jgi:Na+-transporting NADH:ubiquinone oxidoreductase subunit NqrD